MSESGKIPPIALLALMALTVIWGYSWIVMKTVLHYISAFDFTALRSALAAMLLLAILKLSGKGMTPPPFIPTMTIGLLQTVGMAILSQLALVSGGAGKTAIMAYTMPFWLILLSALFLKERLRYLQITSVMVAAVGLILILQPWTMSSSLLSPSLAVLSGLCWAISAIVAKRLYARQSVHLLSLTTWQMTYGSGFLIVFTLLVGDHHIDPAPYLWFALSYNVILVTALAWLLWLYVLKNMPANIAGLSVLAVPVLGAVLSWWLLDEQLNQFELTGMILIVFALIALNIPSLQRNRKNRAKPNVQ